MARKVKEAQRESAKVVYDRLKNDREPYVTRAVDCAKVTIPALFPKDSDSGTTKYETPYQSTGARGVNNLAAKLSLALLPPNSPFFRLSPAEELVAEIEKNEDMKQKISTALRKREFQVMRHIDSTQIRVTIWEALKQLIVAGNALLYLPKDKKGIKLYKLHSYVLQRDAFGTVLQIVTLETIAFSALPEGLQAMAAGGQQKKPEDPIEVYTHTYLEGDFYLSYQEVEGQVVKGTENTYPKERSPWIPARMIKMDGEHYGRSYVEEYLGDLKSLEQLSQAIIDLASIAASVRFLVNPSGMTRVKKVTDAKNGDFVAGRLDDIGVLQLNKYADLQVAKSTADDIKANLTFAFLVNSAVQRNGERVTAEEIRYVAGELEDTLGGVYSILSQELQLPLVRCLLSQLEASGTLTEIPEGLLEEPQITTGMEALGRGQDLSKLEYFLKIAVEASQAKDVTGLKMNNFMSRVADGLNLDEEGLIKSDEEIMAEQERSMQMQMALQAAGPMAQGVLNGAPQE